jgi:anthranilate/para-aminobenzoate synthase component I
MVFDVKSNLKKKEFLNFISEGQLYPLYKEVSYREPYKIYENLNIEGEGILLESVKGPFNIARYSFIAFDPYLIFKSKDREIEIRKSPQYLSSVVSFREPLEKLKELLKVYPQKDLDELPPFQGGAIGLISYDFVRYLEKIPELSIDDIKIPDVHFIFVDKVIAFDHMREKAWIIISPGVRETELGYRDLSNIDWNNAYDKAVEWLSLISEKIDDLNLDKEEKVLKANNFFVPELNYEMTKKDYMDIVKKAKEYIAQGDIFQANLSQRISSYVGDISPWDIYKTLRKVNPSPFSVYADLGDYYIVSSSPERLIKVKGVTVETRPIAGTRPRGKNIDEDEMLRAELLLNEKERAEHIMLIDLERNDIGKVSEFGSVNVNELMITEDYSHVIHIVSNIRGILRKDKDVFDVIKAVFPGGTITGVPKVRCMEIIEELEPVRRGAYTGSIGYISFSGNMDLNIVIRSFLIKCKVAYVQAGAGIVADSDPEREYYETLKKAEALIKTLNKQ